MDDFNTLSNRLLNRAPGVGLILAQQLVQDSWHTLQARQEWSWRRRGSTFAPPNLYLFGSASTNSAAGAPNLITGSGTTWTPDMIGRQIRVGGLMYPYYTIVGWLSPTQLLIDQPWAGPDVSGMPYQILQCFFPVPSDFGYFYVAVSIKDSYRLFLEATQAELAIMDPQRTNQGQTYACVFKDFTTQFGGIVGPIVPVTNAGNPQPISTTSTGFTYIANATYIVQVVAGGLSGTATFQWMRSGGGSFQPTQTTSDQAQDLMDGVQVYWPDTTSPYVAGDLFVINCASLVTQSVPRYELWPAPTYSGYLYPYIYIAKEYDLTAQQPQLPPFVANRGELLLEMALEKSALFPGTLTQPNPYFNLKLADMHRERYENMMIDFCNNDQNVGISNIFYQDWPFSGPWADGSYQQNHAPYLGGY